MGARAALARKVTLAPWAILHATDEHCGVKVTGIMKFRNVPTASSVDPRRSLRGSLARPEGEWGARGM